MRKFALVVALVAVLLALAVPALALNPQSQGRGRKAIAGGTKGLIIFGPYFTQDRMPTGYVMHSGDGAEFWYNTYYMSAATPPVITVEAVPVKVPAATTIVAPVAVSKGDTLYHYIYTNATNVAATDSVYLDPLFGGLGK